VDARIANAMHERFSEDVRPEFIDIIRELQPSDESVARRQPKLLNITTLLIGSELRKLRKLGLSLRRRKSPKTTRREVLPAVTSGNVDT
jgi:hypothetical protein